MRRVWLWGGIMLVAGLGGCGGADDERAPTWDFISPLIIQPNCATASCHSRAAAVAGLDLSTAARGYRSLLDSHLPRRASQPEKVRPLLVPFNPDESHLVRLLRGDGTRRMPPDRPLPEADIRLIERWILDGARESQP